MGRMGWLLRGMLLSSLLVAGRCLVLLAFPAEPLKNMFLYKNDLELPEFLLSYDLSVVEDNVLSVDSGRAFFDSIHLLTKDNMPHCKGELLVFDGVERIWEGEFHCSASEKEIYDITEHIRAVPLSSPHIIDVFPYNGDFIAEFRVKYLYDHVDEFIIIEAATTFSGNRKSNLIFTNAENTRRFAPYMSKITYVVVEMFPPYFTRSTDVYASLMDKKMNSSWLNFSQSFTPEFVQHLNGMLDNPNFWRANYQRLFAKFFIRPPNIAGERQLILVTDCDELPNRTQFLAIHDIVRGKSFVGDIEPTTQYYHAPIPLFMMFFYYNFDTVNPYSWQQAYAISTEGYLNLKDMLTPRIPRPDSHPEKGYFIEQGGWHLSYFMSLEDIRRKVESIADQNYYNTNSQFQSNDHIRYCITNSVDLYFRDDFMSSAWVSRSKLRVKSFPEGWEQLQQDLLRLQE